MAIFNPQTVYKKDLSGCKFQVTEEDMKNPNIVYYIPSYNWDLSGVNLCGTNIYAPFEYIKNNELSMPYNIDKAIIDKKTVLPEMLKLQVKSKNLSFKDEKLDNLIQYMTSQNISLDEIINYTKIIKNRE